MDLGSWQIRSTWNFKRESSHLMNLLEVYSAVEERYPDQSLVCLSGERKEINIILHSWSNLWSSLPQSKEIFCDILVLTYNVKNIALISCCFCCWSTLSKIIVSSYIPKEIKHQNKNFPKDLLPNICKYSVTCFYLVLKWKYLFK